MKKKYSCEIDCANCAMKVEAAMKNVDGVIDARLNFLTQKLTLEAADENFDAVLKAAIEAGKRVESDFEVEV